MARAAAKPAPVVAEAVARVPRGTPVRVRIGGPDEAPAWRLGEVTKEAPTAVLVHLDGQYDADLDPTLKRLGHPARSGEAIVFSPCAEGLGLGQFQRI